MTSRFLNKIRENRDQEPARTAKPSSAKLFPHHSPLLLPALLEMRRPELGSRLAAGHPQGLALTPARTAPHSPEAGSRGQRHQDEVPFDRLRAHTPPAPFDRLRAHFASARPSTSSGHTSHPRALRQAQGTSTQCPSTSSGHNSSQDHPLSAVVPYSGLPAGSYDNSMAPFPNVLDSTSRRAVGTVPSPNNRFPLPSRTG
jgi:hypothetical protein